MMETHEEMVYCKTGTVNMVGLKDFLIKKKFLPSVNSIRILFSNGIPSCDRIAKSKKNGELQKQSAASDQ